MAVGAVINALWDLRAKREGKPLWALLSALSPEEIVDLVDFRYLSDALTREDALAILQTSEPGRQERAQRLRESGYPAYTTTPGWLGYDDEKLHRLSVEAVEDGFTFIKLKVGRDVEEDVRRMGIARDAVGPDVAIAIDANQRWEVSEAIDWVRKLGEQPTVLDRGAHQPRRHPGPRSDPRGRRAGARRDGRACRQPGRLQADAHGWIA